MENRANSETQQLMEDTSACLDALYSIKGDDRSDFALKRKFKEDSFRSMTDTCVNTFLDKLLNISEKEYFAECASGTR
eukprot:7340859-Prymnesium_polylepis.1